MHSRREPGSRILHHRLQANFWYGVNGVNVQILGCVSNVLTPAEVTRKSVQFLQTSLHLLMFMTIRGVCRPVKVGYFLDPI